MTDKKRILILGATSAIAMESAKIWASRGADLCLVARSEDKMSALSQDLETRGAKNVVSIQSDLSQIEAHAQLLRSISSQFGDFDTVLVAYGTLGSQKKCEESFEETLKELNTNFLSVVSILTPIANILETRGTGTIAVITSVAGDRGRKSNYVYGTAKGALSRFLQGLRNRFGKTGVHVVDIKPGFTDTPMTSDFPKGPLFVSPKVVGQGIVNAIDKKRNTAYIPWFWEGIMLIIKHIPEFIFKKMSL
jgi:decaprenylphospho-beta-D-erythro-pentofuranosid-2-ulose 2-reductase